MTATLILTLISAIAGTLTNLLTANGVIPPNLQGLVTASVAAGTAMFNALRSGVGAAAELQAVLSALQAELAAVRQDTSADPAVVSLIAELDNLVGDAITGFTQASSGAVDPASLPVPPAVE